MATAIAIPPIATYLIPLGSAVLLLLLHPPPPHPPQDSSEPINLSGSQSQSQGGYSHGMIPSQGVSVSQDTGSQTGHQVCVSSTVVYEDDACM